MVEVFYELGVRQMLFAYNRNNLAGGGCHDQDVGLTDFGRALVKEMNRVGMIVDCTHCSFKTAMEAMELSAAPVIFSHSNARSLRDHERNIREEQIVSCAAGGGVIGTTGIGLFVGADGATIDGLVRHIDHMVELVGADHVGVGMDSVLVVDENARFAPSDRSYWPESQYPETGTDCLPPEGFPSLTQALLVRGYSDKDIACILGGNFLRIAQKVWKP
jgi:membrane dipeptidase